MNRDIWASRVITLVALLLATLLTGCGGDNSGQARGKRLGGQGPCALVKLEELEKTFARAERIPSEFNSQCSYLFEKVSVNVQLDPKLNLDGAAIEIEGVSAKEIRHNFGCYIDVWLVPGDQSQRFMVTVNKRSVPTPESADCDGGIMVARMILNSLPE